MPDQQPRSDSGPRPSIDPEPFALSDGRSSPFDWLVRTGLPLLLLVFMVSLSLLLWRRERSRYADELTRETRTTGERLEQRIERVLDSRTRQLQLLAMESRTLDVENFRTAAEASADIIPSCNYLAWFDAQGKILFHFTPRLPGSPRQPATGGATYPVTDIIPDWNKVWLAAQQSSAPLITRPYSRPGAGTVFGVVVSAFSSTSPPSFAGAALCEVKLEEMVASAIDSQARQQFEVRIDYSRRLLFASSPEAAIDGSEPNEAVIPVRLPQMFWTLHIRPLASQLVAGQHTANWMLAIGIVSSCVIALGILQAHLYRRRDLQQARAYANTMEKLHRIVAAISAKLGSGEDVLHQLALAAGQLLQMSKTAILVVEQPPGQQASAADIPIDISTMDDEKIMFRMVACTGWDNTMVGQRFPLSSFRTARAAVREKHVVAVDDARNSEVQWATVGNVTFRSILQIPLLIEGRVIGLMTLGDERPHQFTSDERRLAQLWAHRPPSRLPMPSCIIRRSSRCVQRKHCSNSASACRRSPPLSTPSPRLMAPSARSSSSCPGSSVSICAVCCSPLKFKVNSS